MAKNYVSVKLSSKWTDIGFYGLWLLYLVIPLILFMAIAPGQPINWMMVGIAVILTIIIVLCQIYLTKGYIKNNIIYLKKYFRKEVSFPIESIYDVQVFETRRDDYILLTISHNEKKEKFLLVTTNVFYAGEVRNTVEVLNEIVDNNIKQILNEN